jgi:hypothetical protein
VPYSKWPTRATRVVPRDSWSQMPVQPSAGQWQRRFRWVSAAFMVTVVMGTVIGLATSRQIHRPVALVEAIFAIVALEMLVMWVILWRSTQTRRKEYSLGYTTWPTALGYRPNATKDEP